MSHCMAHCKTPLRPTTTATTYSTDYTGSDGAQTNSGECNWGRGSHMQVYRTSAQSLENKRRKFTETVGMSAYEYLQRLSYVKQRHHPENKHCSQGYTLLRKTSHRQNQQGIRKHGYCQVDSNQTTAPQVIREVRTVYVPVTPIHQNNKNYHSASAWRLEGRSSSSIPKVNINYRSPAQPHINQNIQIQQAPHQEGNPISITLMQSDRWTIPSQRAPMQPALAFPNK